MSLEVGTRIGPYQITGTLGAGGMGEVYRARDPRLNRDVALKVLPDVFAADPERLARFRREAQVLASLNHPNIGHIYGLEEGGDTPLLVLELVDGPTLADRIADGPIPIAEALALGKQVAEGLEAAHEHGVVHRDIKPANIKITQDGVVKVLDFGLAKTLDPVVQGFSAAGQAGATNSPTIGSPATLRGVILGTPAYMAPEQARGKAVDRRADVWAFGAVLYEMLTARKAFAGEEAADVLAKVIEGEPDWNALPAATPASLRKLLRRCLEKDHRQRLDSIGAARLEIEDAQAALQGEHGGSRPPAPSLVWKWPTLAAIAALLMIGGAILALTAVFGLKVVPVDESGRGTGTVAGTPPPLVVMMDSPHPLRVYDKETLAANGTNADVISDILSDLPVRRQKEAIGPEWRRDEEILRFAPDLIVIHYSGFNQEEDSQAPRERLKILIEFFVEAQTRFLIYSRQREADLNARLAALLADVYSAHPGLRERIRAFGVLDYGPPRWINTTSGSQLKLVVKQMLKLP